MRPPRLAASLLALVPILGLGWSMALPPTASRAQGPVEVDDCTAELYVDRSAPSADRALNWTYSFAGVAFDRPGLFGFRCNFHLEMRGAVRVLPAPPIVPWSGDASKGMLMLVLLGVTFLASRSSTDPGRA